MDTGQSMISEMHKTLKGQVLEEAGVEMEHFENESQFSSWAEFIPECKESAGKKLSTKIRKGNEHLKLALIDSNLSYFIKRKFLIYINNMLISCGAGLLINVNV